MEARANLWGRFKANRLGFTAVILAHADGRNSYRHRGFLWCKGTREREKIR